MRNRCIVMLCATVLLSIQGQATTVSNVASPQSPMSSLQQEMIDLQKAFVGAQERGDVEYVKSALADDFTSIETNGDSSGKSDFLRDLHAPEQPGPSPILYEFKVIELDEGCAVVTYKAVFAGHQLERYQHLSDIWVKQGGKWKLTFRQSTLNLWSAHDLD